VTILTGKAVFTFAFAGLVGDWNNEMAIQWAAASEGLLMVR
jgi:hypothetical protein